MDNNIPVLLDPAIDHTINSIREIESDYPEISTEECLHYIITRIMATLYSKENMGEMASAIGVLECAKLTHAIKG